MSNCKCVVFSDRAYNDIVVETRKKNPLETGGILLGHILDNGIWVVMEVLPPGPDSIFQHAYFEYDERFVNYLAQSKATEYEQELNLLGLWHRHPGSMDTFSGTDDGTNRTFARLNQQGAISGLVNLDPKFRLTMYHVSNPFRYDKVAIEVGDDLIPEEYFKLKYPSSEGLNPTLPLEKKNESTNTGKGYAIGSGTTGRKTIDAGKSGVASSSGLKNVALIVFLVLFALSLNNQWLHNKVGRVDKVEVSYTQEPRRSEVDSVRRAAQESLRELKIKREKKREQIDAKVAAFVEWKRKDVKDKPFVKLKLIVNSLWTLTVLAFLLTVYLWGKRLFCRGGGKKGAWFQRNPKLYAREDDAIMDRFGRAERSVENETVSYFIPTDKRVAGQDEKVSFQMVFANDYDKSRDVKIYLVEPELSALLGQKIADFPYVEKDGAGEYYLDFSDTMDKGKASGMRAVDKLSAWLRQYERWHKQEINLKDFKL